MQAKHTTKAPNHISAISCMLFLYKKGNNSMAVMRVHKTRDYTVMSNTHFREREMSLKAKGLLSLMFSLPDTWDYSIAGLVAICKENETAIKSTLNELKRFGYLSVTKLMPNQTQSGRIEYVYDIFEKPTENENLAIEKQGVENLGVEFQGVEKQGQLSNKELNTEKSITKQSITNKGKDINTPTPPEKIKFKIGTYENVLISNEEITKLVESYGEEDTRQAIEYLSEYIELKGNYKAKSHYLAIKKWVIDAIREKRVKQQELEQREQRAKEIEAKQKADENKYMFNGKRISDLTHAEYEEYLQQQKQSRPTAPVYNWLEPNKNDEFSQRHYSKEEMNSLYDDLDDIEI